MPFYKQYYKPLLGAASYGGRLFYAQSRTQRYNKNKGASSLIITKRKRTGVRSDSFQQKALKIAQAKHRPNETIVNTGGMTHNSIYTMNVTARVGQSVTEDGRIGDQIYLEALKLRGSYHCPTINNGYTLRVIVCYSGEEYDPTSGLVLFGSGLGTSELFLPSTSGIFGTNAMINPKTVSVIFDQTIDVNSLTSDTKELQSFAWTVPLKQKFSYQRAADKYGKFKNLYVVVVSTAIDGVTGTTNTGQLYMSTDLIYKNA